MTNLILAPTLCQICCNNLKQDKFLTCGNCSDQACVYCYKKFIFEGISNHAICIFCKEVFSTDFLFKSFPKSWMVDYKKYQKKFAIDREKSKLQLSMPDVKNILYKKNLPYLIAEKKLELKKLIAQSTRNCNYTKHNKNLIDIFNFRKNKIASVTNNIDVVNSYIYKYNQNCDAKYKNVFQYLIVALMRHYFAENKEFIKYDIDKITTYTDAHRVMVEHKKRNYVENTGTKIMWKTDSEKNLLFKLLCLNEIPHEIFGMLQRLISIINPNALFNSAAKEIKNLMSFLELCSWERFDLKNYKIIDRECSICKFAHAIEFDHYSRHFIICLLCNATYCKKCNMLQHMSKCGVLNHQLYLEKLTEIHDVSAQLQVLKLQKEQNIDRNVIVEEYEEENKTHAFLYPCTVPDCKGFVRNVRVPEQKKFHNICELCSTVHCKLCNEKMHSNSCNPDIMENKKIIENDSKKCPKCNVLIFKSSGCNQMFCTMCKTGFDWRTLKIIKNKSIHNPHFIELMENLRANNITRHNVSGDLSTEHIINTFACEFFTRWAGHLEVVMNRKNTNDAREYSFTRLVEAKMIFPIVNYKKTIKNNILIHHDALQIEEVYIKNNVLYASPLRLFTMIYQRVAEIEETIREIAQYGGNTFGKIRVNYLLNKITEQMFEEQIGNAEIKNNKFIALGEILNTFACIVTDYLMALTKDNYESTLTTIYNVIKFTNNAICDTANLMSMRIMIINLTGFYRLV